MKRLALILIALLIPVSVFAGVKFDPIGGKVYIAPNQSIATLDVQSMTVVEDSTGIDERHLILLNGTTQNRWLLSSLFSWIQEKFATKTENVPGAFLLFEASGTSTQGFGMVGPDNVSETYYAKPPDAAPANSIPSYAAPSGSSGPGNTKISDITWKATPSGDLVGTSDTQELTNKTFNANATGNVLKGYGFITLPKPHVYGSAVTAQVTTTARSFGQVQFLGTAESNNYVEYLLEVPRDLDTTVDLTAWFSFVLTGADTGDHDYVISMIDIAASGDNGTATGDAVSLDYTADASGASGDVETAGGNTLTGWAAALTPGSKWIIRITRDGDDETNDTSIVDSISGPLTIRYGFTQ
jgi:hypothetical protein